MIDPHVLNRGQTTPMIRENLGSRYKNLYKGLIPTASAQY